jgi:hypothetical protein
VREKGRNALRSSTTLCPSHLFRRRSGRRTITIKEKSPSWTRLIRLAYLPQPSSMAQAFLHNLSCSLVLGSKSRKERPCDFCRRRQVSCKIDVAPPCQLCLNHGRACTFVERPKQKRRPNNSVGDGRNVTILGEFCLKLGTLLLG